MNQRTGVAHELAVRTAPHDDSSVLVSVRDTGTGFAHGVEDLFEPFRTTKSEGMGMGLAIARSIVEAHGGRIWAENNPEHGATVTFTLPASTNRVLESSH